MLRFTVLSDKYYTTNLGTMQCKVHCFIMKGKNSG